MIYCNHISVLLGRSLHFRPHIRCQTFRPFKVYGSGTMASFRIHEDQENTALGLRKEADVFAAATQRRALGDLSQFAVHQNRNLKHVSCTSNYVVRKSVTNECSIFPQKQRYRHLILFTIFKHIILTA